MSLLPADHTGLQSRVEAALRRAAGLLDEPDPGGMPLSDAISRLRERLEDSAEDLMSVREQLATGDRLHARYALRFHALDDARAAAGRLRELTAPQAILDGAPEALCGASEFERSLVSLFGDGRMTAHAAYFHNDRAGGHGALRALSQRPVLLEHPLVEAELVRRRRATIVTEAGTGARVDPTWQAVMGWRSYAAAPLVMGSALIGIVHADRGAESQLDILDRDVLWQFTTSLAQIYERAMLHRQLRHEREQLRTFLEWLGARSGELTDSPVKLSTFSRRPRPPLAEAGATAPGAPIDDRAVFDGLLTRRELEVLRLLADGRSNRAIAEALTISQGTVKFHVNRILRKLRVTNRSQAVARYLRLLGAAIR